ncbi:hypothetical protein ACIBEJ_00825 [Nonomuraea sp. NPDC050790]|uniref:hypothetical protein n=1 Tax=Nonomuraea sp. NPDC050790 TaxID=3364371 RepID=UPI003792525B
MSSLIETLPDRIAADLVNPALKPLRHLAESLHERTPHGLVHDFIIFGLESYDEATSTSVWKTEIRREANRLLARDANELEELLA